MEEINIGAKVQEYRSQRQFSLRELAARADITPSMLSQIENNTANPSINSIRAIAAALDVPIFKFFQCDTVSENLIVRKGNYVQLCSAKEGVVYDLLTSDLSGSIEFCKMEIPPHSLTSSKARAHVGEEVAYVISGSIRIHMNGQEFGLDEGDSVKIPAGVSHVWENVTDTASVIIFAITPPSF